MEDYKKALDDFSKTIEIDLYITDAYYYRGITKIADRNAKSAVSDFTKAIELQSNDGRYFKERGFAYLILGEWKAADADFKKALELDPALKPAIDEIQGLFLNLL
jgi:Flp pilus assembly protein TadD